MSLGNLLMIMIGLSGGIAVGSGLVALLTVLDIIPRLAQLTRNQKRMVSFQWSLILGACFFTVIDLLDLKILLPLVHLFIMLFGGIAGIFVGLLAAALTEVLNVLPILSKRLGMKKNLLALLMAMVFGKVFGSLFHWLIFLHP